MRVKELSSDQFRRYFESRLQGHKFQRSTGGVVTTCCFHDDRNPSLSLNFDKGVWRCHTGCGGGGIIEFEKRFSQCDNGQAISNISELIGEAQLMIGAKMNFGAPEVVYNYIDEYRKLVFQVVRYPKDPQTGKKKILQRRPCSACDNGKSSNRCTNPKCRHGWLWQKEGTRKILYHLPEVITANEVWITEGEKACDRLIAELEASGKWHDNMAVTTSPEGAGKWRDEYSPYLTGKKVIVLPDNDDPGEAHAQTIAMSVDKFAVGIKVVHLPELGEKEDVYDFFDRSYKIEDLIGYVKATAIWKPMVAAGTKMFVSVVDFIKMAPAEKNWVIENLIEYRSNGFIISKPKGGKAQPVDTPVLTPDGWRRMGDLRVGHLVIDEFGLPVKIREIHPQGIVPCYRVTMSDGTSTEATADHLWLLESHNDRTSKRAGKLNTTEHIREQIIAGKQRFSHIPMALPARFRTASLPIGPYVLGAILGDGGITTSQITITSDDADLAERVKQEIPNGTRITYLKSGRAIAIRTDSSKRSAIKKAPMLEALRSLGLLGLKSAEKFIPRQYLHASVGQRIALLQGLMDTDGCFEGHRKVTYCTISYRLALGVQELVESLGGTATIRKKKCYYKKDGRRIAAQNAYMMAVKLPREVCCPFFIKRKAEAWRTSRHGKKKIPSRTIVSIEFSREVEAQCITVDSASGLYVAEHYIVTHNSFSTVDMCIALASGHNWFDFKVLRTMRVAHLSREDNPDTTSWRYKQLLRGRGLNEEEVREKIYINTRNQTPRFMLDEEEWVIQLIQDMKSLGTEFFVLDVLNKMHGAEENDNTEMRQVMDRVDYISRETGAQWAIVHHYNKSGGDEDTSLTEMMRGASAIAGSAEWLVGYFLVDEEKQIRKAKFDTKSSLPPKPFYWNIDSADEVIGGGILIKTTEYERPSNSKGKRKSAAAAV